VGFLVYQPPRSFPRLFPLFLRPFAGEYDQIAEGLGRWSATGSSDVQPLSRFPRRVLPPSGPSPHVPPTEMWMPAQQGPHARVAIYQDGLRRGMFTRSRKLPTGPKCGVVPDLNLLPFLFSVLSFPRLSLRFSSRRSQTLTHYAPRCRRGCAPNAGPCLTVDLCVAADLLLLRKGSFLRVSAQSRQRRGTRPGFSRSLRDDQLLHGVQIFSTPAK